MLTSQSVGEHLPMLRRYARALTGSQKSGDSYVAAALEAMISQSDVMDDETSVSARSCVRLSAGSRKLEPAFHFCG